MREEEIVDIIIDGLDPKMAKDVLLMNPQTIEALTRAASMVEQTHQRFYESQNVVNDITPSNPVKRDLEVEIDFLKKRFEDLLTVEECQVNGQPFSRKNGGGLRCWYCGEPGHV